MIKIADGSEIFTDGLIVAGINDGVELCQIDTPFGNFKPFVQLHIMHLAEERIRFSGGDILKNFTLAHPAALVQCRRTYKRCAAETVQLLVTPWTAAHQALLSMGFSRQEKG